MQSKLTILDHNETHIRIDTDRSILQDLSERFSFQVPGYQFMPAYRFGWDGYIRLLNLKSNTLYKGLIHYIKSYCREENIEFYTSIKRNNYEYDKSFEDDIAQHGFSLRDYQRATIVECLSHSRGLILSPTGSGKSLIIYGLVKQYIEERILIIVPTIQLVSQMEKDFKEYGNEELVHAISSGKEKKSKARITVSTWQSLQKMSAEFFNQYDCIIVDEAHTAKAKVITSIMEKATKVKYRFGFTGTLDGMLTNQMVIEGLFGKIINFVKTKELQDDGTLADLKIKCIILKHTDANRKLLKGAEYQKEMDYIVTNQERNKFIINLVDHLKGPTLVLFQYVDKHGKVIHKMMQDHKSTKPAFIIHGGVEVEEREDIRALIDTGDDMVLFASYGTFQAGINAPKIRNIVFASPSKSRIRNLQSIGRGLRKAEGKDKCNLFDISDDITNGKKINHTYRHFAERLKIYISEGFDYKIIKHDLKG